MQVILKVIQTEMFKRLVVGLFKIYSEHSENKVDDDIVLLIEEVLN